MNNVNLIGRLTRDPEMRKGSETTSMLHFTLAVNQRKTKSNPNPSADFISCIAWNGVANIISKYCKKGSRIGVTGHVHAYSFVRNGEKRHLINIIVHNVEFLDPPRKGTIAQNEGEEPNPKLSEQFDSTEVSEQEIPF